HPFGKLRRRDRTRALRTEHDDWIAYRTLRSLQVAGIDARMPLVDRFFKVGFHDQKYMRFAYIYIRVAAPSTFCPATSRPRCARTARLKAHDNRGVLSIGRRVPGVFSPGARRVAA